MGAWVCATCLGRGEDATVIPTKDWRHIEFEENAKKLGGNDAA